MVSFGQGCEGEPSLAFEVIAAAIAEMRRQTRRGLININTSAIVNRFRTELMDARLCDLYAKYQDREDALIDGLTDLYTSIVGNNLGRLLRAINIEKIVVDKIDAFDAAELESMIFEVMKKELNAIVYLGAGLGFLMGFVNLLW